MLHKKLFSSLLLFSLLLLGVLSSCALQAPSTGAAKYQKAITLYEGKNYYEALQLLESALPLLCGKKEEASAHFYRAYCSFNQRKYIQSSDRFRYFRETFRRDPRVEEALYMQGYALYLESPDVQVDQAFTQEAAGALHDYLRCYPEGTYTEKATTQLEELELKLALKDFNSAKLYHQLGYYRAAVIALGDFQKDFPASFHNEAAAYLKADAQYRYCQGMKDLDKEEPFNAAIKYCQEFLDNYPNSRHALVIGEHYATLSAASNSLAPLKH